jgi:hypothetical protein
LHACFSRLIMLERSVLQQDPGQDFHLIIEKGERPGKQLSIECKDTLISTTAQSIVHL